MRLNQADINKEHIKGPKNMSLSSSDFVTNDSYDNSRRSPDTVEETASHPVKENIRGVRTAGWVLAFLLPFVGIILNVWIVKNREKYDIGFFAAIIPALISTALSAALAVLLFQIIFQWALV